MKSKPGASMVEMGDCYAVDRAISHLNNNFLFNQKLNVWYVSIGLFIFYLFYFAVIAVWLYKIHYLFYIKEL